MTNKNCQCYSIITRKESAVNLFVIKQEAEVNGKTTTPEENLNQVELLFNLLPEALPLLVANNI